MGGKEKKKMGIKRTLNKIELIKERKPESLKRERILILRAKKQGKKNKKNAKKRNKKKAKGKKKKKKANRKKKSKTTKEEKKEKKRTRKEKKKAQKQKKKEMKEKKRRRKNKLKNRNKNKPGARQGPAGGDWSSCGTSGVNDTCLLNAVNALNFEKNQIQNFFKLKARLENQDKVTGNRKGKEQA